MSKDCIFCKIAKKEISKELVTETDNFIAFLDINPKAPGHTLVIPKKHYVTILDLPNTLAQEMIKLSKKIASILLEQKMGDGFNILINNLPPAGQVVPHLHIHVIPRKETDTLITIS